MRSIGLPGPGDFLRLGGVGDPTAEGEEGVAQPIQVLQCGIGLFHESVEGHRPPLGPTADRPRQVALGQGGVTPGQDEVAQGGKRRFEGVDPVFERFNLRGVHRQGARPRSFRVSEHAADAEEVVLHGVQPVQLGGQGRMARQSADDGIELVEGTVGFDAGVVLVDAVPVEQRGLAAVSGAGVNAHGVKVGMDGPMRRARSTGLRAARVRARSLGAYLRAVDQPVISEKQRRYDLAYLRMAQEWAQLSHCQRKQVGALIVRDGMIVSDGYNGTPSGFPNVCETEEGTTHWYVLHAEANAITKLARSTHTAEGATLYITLSPCRDCAKLIHQVGIRRVVYRHAYKDESGLTFLNQAGVEIVRYPEDAD